MYMLSISATFQRTVFLKNRLVVVNREGGGVGGAGLGVSGETNLSTTAVGLQAWGLEGWGAGVQSDAFISSITSGHLK